jgi:hypothetical protein
MVHRKSLLVLAFAALVFSFSIQALAGLSKRTSDPPTEPSSESGATSYQGTQFELFPPGAFLRGPDTTPADGVDDNKPEVEWIFREADGTTSTKSTGDVEHIGQWTADHHKSPNRIDTLTCAAAECLKGFKPTLTTPAGNTIANSVAINGSQFGFDGVYTIAQIILNNDESGTIELADKLPGKNGVYLDPEVTVSSAGVFVGIGDPDDADIPNAIYARLYEGEPGDSPIVPKAGNTLHTEAVFGLSAGPWGPLVDCDALAIPQLPLETCAQEGWGEMFYEVATVRTCETVAPDPVTRSEKGDSCTWSADYRSGQLGIVHLPQNQNNYEACWDGAKFVRAITYIADVTKQNKPNIDAVYPEVPGVWERGEAFRLAFVAQLGQTAAQQRGANTPPCELDLGTDLSVISSITFTPTFLTRTHPLLKVDATAVATPSEVPLNTGSYKLDIIPGEDVSKAVLAGPVELRYDANGRLARVVMDGEPTCPFVSAECLHVRFISLATYCAVAYVHGSGEPPSVPAGFAAPLPIRAPFDGTGDGIADGNLVDETGVARVILKNAFTFDADLCSPGAHGILEYFPEL